MQGILGTLYSIEDLFFFIDTRGSGNGQILSNGTQPKAFLMILNSSRILPNTLPLCFLNSEFDLQNKPLGNDVCAAPVFLPVEWGSLYLPAPSLLGMIPLKGILILIGRGIIQQHRITAESASPTSWIFVLCPSPYSLSISLGVVRRNNLEGELLMFLCDQHSVVFL